MSSVTVTSLRLSAPPQLLQAQPPWPRPLLRYKSPEPFTLSPSDLLGRERSCEYFRPKHSQSSLQAVQNKSCWIGSCCPDPSGLGAGGEEKWGHRPGETDTLKEDGGARAPARGTFSPGAGL